jgi:hypothetical protein
MELRFSFTKDIEISYRPLRRCDMPGFMTSLLISENVGPDHNDALPSAGEGPSAA